MGLIFYTLLIGLLYLLTFLSLKDRNYGIFLPVYFVYVFCYDFIFIHAAYHIDPRLLAVLKPYNEYLCVYFLAVYFAGRRKKISSPHLSGTDRNIGLFLILPSFIVLLINDLAPHLSVMGTINGLRMYVLPILMPFLMARCGVFEGFRPEAALRLFFGFMLFVGIYGCFQRLFFIGDVESLWFYDYFDRFGMNPVYYGEANYVRNNMLRVTSIFVSPLTYSVSVALTILLLAGRFIFPGSKKGETRWLNIALLLFFLFCLWSSGTRVGFVIVAIGLPLLFLIRRGFTRLLLLAAVPAAAVAATFIFLTAGGTKEASALGRLDQYGQLLQNFSFTGLGFSHPFVHTYFDTFYLSLILLYGLFVVAPLYFLALLFRRAGAAVRNNPDNHAYALILVIALTFIYTFAFQYIAGSTPYKMLFIFLFLIPAYEQYKAGTADDSRALPA